MNIKSWISSFLDFPTNSGIQESRISLLTLNIFNKAASSQESKSLLLILYIFNKKLIRPEAASKFRIPGIQDFAISGKESKHECKRRRQIRTIRN